MHPDALQAYLRDHIPLSAAMGVEVLKAGADTVLLGAPLAPNINHRDTVFGGSASALAILAGWSLVHVRLAEESISCRIVIQHSSVDFDKAMPEAFRARSFLAEPESWPKFLTTLQRRGKARVQVDAVLESDGVTAGRFRGDFVAIDLGSRR